MKDHDSIPEAELAGAEVFDAEAVVEAELILDAEVISDASAIPPAAKKAKRSFLGCFLPALLIFGVLFACLFGAGYFFYRALGPSNVVHKTAEEIEEELKASFAKGKIAFSQPAGVEEGIEFERISELITRVSETVDQSVNEDLDRVIDVDRYMDEVRRNPELGSYAYFGRDFLKSIASHCAVGPIPFSEFQIFKIEKLENDDRMVLLHTNGDYGSMPYQFWVTKSKGSRWKLYDWQPLDYGIRDSKETAITVGEQNVRHNRDYSRYSDIANELILENDYVGDKYDTDEIERMLRESESLVVHPLIQSTILIDTATHWNSIDKNDEAIRCLDLIKKPELAPGLYRQKTQLYMEEGKFEEALASIEDYESILGPSYSLLEVKANCYSNLNESDREVETRRQMLSYHQPYYSTNLFQLMELDPESFDDALERVATASHRESVYEQIRDQVGSHPYFTSELKTLAEHLEKTQPKSASSFEAKSNLLFAQGSNSEGIELFRRAIQAKAEAEGSTSEPYISNLDYWALAIEKEVLRDAFGSLSAGEKKVAFPVVVEYFDSYFGNLADADLNEIAVDYAKVEKDSPLVYYVLAETLFFEGQHDDALDLYKKAYAAVTESNDEIEVLGEGEVLESRIVTCFGKLGRYEEAMKLAKGDQIGALLKLAEGEGELKSVQPLVAGLDAGSAGKRYFELLSAVEAGEETEAVKKLAVILRDFENEDTLDFAMSDEDDSLDEYDPFADFADFDEPLMDDQEVFTAWTGSQKLVELYEEDEDASLPEVFGIAPSEDVFNVVSRMLIVRRDWVGCKQLAMIARDQMKDPESLFGDREALWQFEYRFEMARGNLKFFKKFDAANRVARSDLDIGIRPDFEIPVRAAIRLGDLKLAEKIANTEIEGSCDAKLQCLVALNKKDFVAFAEHVNSDSLYDTVFFKDDPDVPVLTDVEWRQALSAVDGTSYFSTYSRNSFERFQLAYDDSIVVTDEDVAKWADAVFSGAAVEIAKLKEQRIGNEAWLLVAPNYRMLLSVNRKSFAKMLPTNFGKEDQFSSKLIDAIKNSSVDVSISVTTNLIREGKELELAVAMANAAKDQLGQPSNFAISNYWESGARFSEVVDALIAKPWDTMAYQNHDESRLVFFNEPEVDEQKFQMGLAHAMRQFKQADPSSRQFRIVVRQTEAKLVDDVGIDVTSIKASSYQSFLINGKILNTPLISVVHRQGDEVKVEMEDVFSWELTIGDTKTSGALRSEEK